MQLSNPKVYPITASFEKFLVEQKIMIQEGRELFWNLPLSLDEDLPSNFNSIQNTAKTMQRTLGEYEHGTAEPGDLISDQFTVKIEEHRDASESNRKAALITIRNIYQDLLLTMIAVG